MKVNRLVLENAEGGRVLVDARAGRASSRKRGRACVVVVYPGVNGGADGGRGARAPETTRAGRVLGRLAALGRRGVGRPPGVLGEEGLRRAQEGGQYGRAGRGLAG